ncbi:vWA domain-containing protein [Glycomyces artemisiae]|uniref:Ca-activated chloride channel family protein n=1 Tax=Glycomyces artemisiae TaxID=1076443 RepID=A0A2T0UIY7_9ACTN|nr:von Willebrand factor type A domain-containing protein [Glycomyces artemisiae]PRY57797.1 Ca-activated chloride channel family protein [Glycomyces artemisiae]
MRRIIAIPAAVLLAFAAACSEDSGESATTADMSGQAAPGAVEPYDPDAEMYEVNEAVDPSEDPESTFAVDVDTASYDYARRALLDGGLPPQDQVRPEEFANSFDYGYEEPEGNGFSVRLDRQELPDWYASGDASEVLRVGLQTRTVPDEERADVNLTFVIDVSGSMEGDRIQIVRDSLTMLVGQLRPTDSVAVVTYETDSDVLLEMTEVADGDEIRDAIDDLEARGSTNMQAGLEDGYELAAESFDADRDNRVILLSDGEANVGLTEHDAMLEEIGGEIADGITLLTVGVGDSYNQELLEQLADNGNGWAVYFASEGGAEEVFSERLTSTLGVAAEDAKVQVVFDPATVADYRLIGFENRALEDDEFEDDSVDAGEVGPGHAVTALYAVTPTGEAGEYASVAVRWTDPETGETGEASAEAAVDADAGLDTALLAAAFAEVLRGSASFTCSDLLDDAEALAAASDDPDVDELADLIAIAAELGA